MEKPMKFVLKTLGAINLINFIQVLDQPELRKYSKRVHVTKLRLQTFELLIQEHVVCKTRLQSCIPSGLPGFIGDEGLLPRPLSSG